MAKYSVQQVRRAWEESGRDFRKTLDTLGISRASLYRYLADINRDGDDAPAASLSAVAATPAPIARKALGAPPKERGYSLNVYLSGDRGWIREELEVLA